MSDGTRGLVEEIAAAVAARLEGRQSVSKRVFSVEEACEYTGLTPDAIRCKVAQGKIPVVKFDRRLRFDRRELDRWIEDHTEIETT